MQYDCNIFLKHIHKGLYSDSMAWSISSEYESQLNP